MVAVDVYFECKLTAETDAEELYRDAGQLGELHRHERKVFLFEICTATQLLQQAAAVWPGNSNGGEMVGKRGQVDLQLRPLGL